MPSIVKAHLKDDAVLWSATGTSDNDGKEQVSVAVQIKCRWQDKQGQVTLPSGETIGVDAKVMVSTEIPVGSILWKGKLADLPSPTEDLRQVIAVIGVPDIKNREVYREVMVMAYGDTLPTIV